MMDGITYEGGGPEPHRGGGNGQNSMPGFPGQAMAVSGKHVSNILL